MRERAHTTGDQGCAQTAQTGHAHRKQRKQKQRSTRTTVMGTGPKATVQWAWSRGGGVEYQIYTLDLHFRFTRNCLANSLEKKQYFLRGRNRKCTRKNVLFYFLNVAPILCPTKQTVSSLPLTGGLNVSQYKYSASRLKSTKFCSKR